ncbi:MAG: hypothetical protein ACREX9_18735 [Gammaproteobacteria bacterium]
MKSRLILPLMVALLTSETFAGNLPSTGASMSNGIPASPHQLQVLGLSTFRGAEDSRFSYTRETAVNTYRGLPVSPHQLQILGFDGMFAVLPRVKTAMTTPAD